MSAQSNQTSFSYPSPIVGAEVVLTGVTVNIAYRYKEVTLVDGGIQIESEEKYDYVNSDSGPSDSEDFASNIANSPILLLAVELAKAKSTASITELSEKISQAKGEI